MKFSHFFRIIVFLLFFANYSYSQDSNNISLYLKVGELEETGKFEEAAEILQELIQKDKSSYLYTRLIELYLENGNAGNALVVLKEAGKLFPKDSYFKFTLGQVYEYYEQDKEKALSYYIESSKLSKEPQYKLAAIRLAENIGKHQEAIKLVNELISEEEKSLYYYERGRIYQKDGKLKKAIADYKKAISIDENMPSMLRLADIYLAEKNSIEAKKILEKIIKKGQSLVLPELTLGQLYKEDKEYDKAIELYTQVADKLEGKDRASVLKQLASLYYDIGDYEKAALTFEWVTELVPDDSLSAYFAGFIYEYLGQNSKAKEIYERALKFHPTYAQLLERMAIICLFENKTDEAMEYINKIDPLERDIDYYLVLSEIWSKKKEHNKAVIVLIDGLKDNPTDINILYSLAMQYEYLKERNKAIDTVKKALELEPENPIFLNFLGYVYADMNINLQEAYKLIEKALKQDPNNPAYIDSMAWVLYRMKDYKNALSYAETAYKAMPNDKEIKSHLQAIKEKVGAKK